MEEELIEKLIGKMGTLTFVIGELGEDLEIMNKLNKDRNNLLSEISDELRAIHENI